MTQGKPYVVQITYYYNTGTDRIICYSSVGPKIDALRKNKLVAIQIKETQSMFNWVSAIVNGTFEEPKVALPSKYYAYLPKA